LKIHFENIDHYIQSSPEEVRDVLKKIRETVLKAAPGAEERISYGMPAFNYNGKILVYFAAFKNHIGFYALPSGNQAFQQALSPYKTGKGSIQFPLNKPIPYPLIQEIVKFRMMENSNK
jgi:uncharacterized protein YdhG (YjbR/CyaY superfamily)